MNTGTAYPPVLTLGCGRSGTSIFGELFAALDEYQYQSEPCFSDVMAAFSEGVAVKVPMESCDYPADPGLSFPLKTLLQVVPSVKIFWIVRHPLDAVCSLRVGISQGWSHHPRPPDWQEVLGKSLVERCAHYWTFINGVGFDAVNTIATVVKFGDMIDAPANFANKVLTSAGLVVGNHEPSVKQWASRVQNTNNEEFIEALTSRHSRSDHSVRIGRWRENLSSQEVQMALPIVSDVARRFGYDLTEA